MNSTMLSPDAQALLMLASPLAPGKDGAAKRFSLREWNDLARLIAASDVQRPGALLGFQADDVRVRLGVGEDVAGRIARLLSRGVELALELERLRACGIWTITRADDNYPSRWKERLKERAPVVLFGAGNPRLLTASAAVAIVGSRDVDEPGNDWTRALAARCAREEIVVVSGAARGVDRTAMLAALESSGHAVGVVAESLTQMIRRELREHMASDRLTLVTTSHPDARFTAGAAMERNKYIYALANWAVVVACAAGEGGTWAGAVENLKAGWTPMFVRNGATVPPGNRQLVERGAVAFRLEETGDGGIRDWFGRPYARPADTLPLVARERPPAAAPADAFVVLWPLLREYLSEPRTEADVAAAFGLEKAQVRKWLARALGEGLAEKLKRPVRYRSVRGRDDSQPGLFESREN